MSNHHHSLGSSPSSLNLLNTVETNGLGTITPDAGDSLPPTYSQASSSSPPNPNPTIQNNPPSSDPSLSIWKQSAHPIALFCLYLFRSLAIATYVRLGLSLLFLSITSK